MAKPRVFISSTYYDLRWIRRSVEQFVESMGYEATVFESGDVPFTHSDPLDVSCYREIALCHMLVLVIGGRYGSPSSDGKAPDPETAIDKLYTHYNSVTKREYEVAREQDLPIYIFVEKGVLSEYETYKRNRTAEIVYAHVDSVNIFRLLDDIFSQSRNNLVREFTNADDITSWLREQWAGLFAHFIAQRREQATVGQIRGEIESLTAVVDALKTYSEQLVRTISKKDSEQLISKVEEELQTKRIESIVRRLHYFDHAIETHGLTPEKVFEALRASKTKEEFAELVKASLEDNSCGMLEHFLEIDDSFRELQRLRRELRLPPWHSKEDTGEQGAGANRQGSSVGHAARKFNPQSRRDAPPRPGGGTA